MLTAEAKYKKTGLDWMPEVPEHWEVVRLKNFSTLKARIGFHGLNSTDFIDEGPYCITGTDFNNGTIDFSNCYHVSDYWYDMDVNIQIKNGHILVTKDGTIGKVAIVKNLNQKATLNSGVFVLNPFDKLNSDYFFWVLNSQYFKAQIDLIKKGTTINHLYERDFRNFLFPVPPLSEQAPIVQYIQAKEEKINLFIQKKQRFIELLKEQRKSVVSEQLLVVSKKYAVRRLKFCVTKVGSGVTPRGGAEVYQDEGVIFLRSQNVHNEGLRLENVSYISEEINSEMKGSEVQFNDVLINVTGASIGRCFIYNIDNPANVNQHVCIIRPIQYIINPEFLMLQLQSEKIQTIIDMVEGASREGLTNKNIKNFPLFIPPIEEQKQIVAYIKTETATIDTAIAKAEREIELIKEYKEAMIAEAVSGRNRILKD